MFLMVLYLISNSEVDTNSYQYHQARREAVSSWLSDVCGKTVKEEADQTRLKVRAHQGR